MACVPTSWWWYKLSFAPSVIGLNESWNHTYC